MIKMHYLRCSSTVTLLVDMVTMKPPQNIFFFFFSSFVLTITFAPSISGKDCPPCGSTTVPYPLSTSPTCGDPSYGVGCLNSTLLLPSNSTISYPIISITPSTSRLVIKPFPFLPSTCFASDFGAGGLQLDPSNPFNITGSNTLMYLNCSDSLPPLRYCSAVNPCHVFVNSTKEGTPCRGTGVCCSSRAGSVNSYRIRTWVGGCSAYRSFVELNTEEPPERWIQKEGVELMWQTPREPLCRTQADCEAGANATCRIDPSGGNGTRRCFCTNGLIWNPLVGTCTKKCEAAGDCKAANNAALIAGLTSGLGVALLVATGGFLVYRHLRRIKTDRDRLAKEREEILNANNSSGRTAHNFTGKEMKRATSNFSKDNLLGVGGFGEVFKGILRDGTPVAVKLAKLGNTKSTDQVLNEVRILSQVNHRSLVRLLGCCVELEQPLMVYEFIANGALFEHLHGLRRGVAPLTWKRRLAIAHQTALGLAYLHFSAVPPIYHRDVKSSNILLDEKLNAKVADFGLSRLAESDLSHISTCAQGTLGYLDPEYYRNYQLTDKSDVYSFGVVLLELLTSKKAIDFSREADDVNLAIYVQRRVEEERIMDAVDPSLKEGTSTVELDTMKALGFLAVGCLEERRQNRPSMKEVAEEIEYIMSIEAGGYETSNLVTYNLKHVVARKFKNTLIRSSKGAFRR